MERIITTITFSQYLTFSELQDYLDDHPIEIVQLQVRGLAPDGTRLTIFTKTNQSINKTGNLIYEDAARDGYTIVGITGANALVDAVELESIEQDTRTFLADTSGDSYSSTNLTVASSSRNNLSEKKRGKMFPHPLTWDLEDLGIL